MIQFKISNDPDQKFSVILNNRRVTFRFRYSALIDRWSFDLALDDVPVIHARRVVIGVDLIEAFSLGIGKLFAVPNVPGALPDRQGLPNGMVRLYQVTDDEYEAAQIVAQQSASVPQMPTVLRTIVYYTADTLQIFADSTFLTADRVGSELI